MPLPQKITQETDPCQLQSRWLIDGRVATMLVKLEAALPFGISIISGYRSPEKQEALRQAGRPTAHPDLSTHLSCPATGVDVWPDVAVTDVVKATLGATAVTLGFRWGGGSQVDENGIPFDWNHLDLGPRQG